MKRKIVALLLALIGAFSMCAASAQQGKAYRIGIVREGGPDYAAVEGLKEGLRDLGSVEGRDYVLEGRDLQGDASGLRAAAADLERQKVATPYDPGNPVAVAALKSARDAARQLQVEIVEARVASVRELKTYLASFREQDADAFFYVNDAMIRSQADLIIDAMRAKKVPTMFSFPSVAEQGALAGYGVNLREVGRSSARYVQKILTGANPADMPVESVSRVELALNIRTARDIGVAVPQAVRLSASEIIE